MKDPFIVNRCMFDSTRLIDNNGNFQPSVKTFDALNMAKQNNLDLVCFNEAENGQLPFCKIINYNKWRYQTEKGKKKAQKQTKRETKEIRFTPDIAENDIGHKMRQAKEFLQRGDDVTFVMQLRGRQRIYAKEAEEKLNIIISVCNDCAKVVSRNKSENNIIVKMAKSSVTGDSVAVKPNPIINPVLPTTLAITPTEGNI